MFSLATPFDFSKERKPPIPSKAIVNEISSPVSIKFGILISGANKAVNQVISGNIKKFTNKPIAHTHMIAGRAPATNILGCLAASVLDKL